MGVAADVSEQAVQERTLFESVLIEKTFVDAYCRPLNDKRVERLVAAFDPRALGVAYLSYRDEQTTATRFSTRSTGSRRLGGSGMRRFPRGFTLT